MIHNVQLTLAPRGSKCRAIVDGIDISDSIGDVTVKHHLGDMPHIELHMPAITATIDSQARITMPEATETALKALGWAAPDTYAHLAAAIRDLLEHIADMPIRNSDVDDAAHILQGELIDAGWNETEEP